MAKVSKEIAKILMPVVFACILALSVSAAAPGFSNGEVSQTVNTNAVAEAIVSAINVDSAVVEAVSSVVADAVSANPGATVKEVTEIAVAAVAADGGNVAAIASEIVAAVMAETAGADVITVITDVVSAIAAVSDANVSEVLSGIIASVPPEVLSSLSVEFVTEQGVGLDIPASTFLSTLVEHGVTSLSFAANTVPSESTVFSSAMSAAQQSANDLGVPIEVGQVLNLELHDQNNNAVSNLGGEVTVSLPVSGKSNAGAFFNELKGRLEVLPSRIRNGFIEFKTTHFSYYVLIEAPASVVPDFETVLVPVAEEPAAAVPPVTAPVAPEPTPSAPTVSEPSPSAPVTEPSAADSTDIIFIDEPAAADENTQGALVAENTQSAPSEPVKVNPRTGSLSIIIFVSLTIAAGTGVFLAVRAKRAKSL